VTKPKHRLTGWDKTEDRGLHLEPGSLAFEVLRCPAHGRVYMAVLAPVDGDLWRRPLQDPCCDATGDHYMVGWWICDKAGFEEAVGRIRWLQRRSARKTTEGKS